MCIFSEYRRILVDRDHDFFALSLRLGAVLSVVLYVQKTTLKETIKNVVFYAEREAKSDAVVY
jgi:undecaprenyl pyrophosphate phosphatase UppP